VIEIIEGYEYLEEYRESFDLAYDLFPISIGMCIEGLVSMVIAIVAFSSTLEEEESMDCPINQTDCSTCEYSKEGLCDYPYIGATKVPLGRFIGVHCGIPVYEPPQEADNE